MNKFNEQKIVNFKRNDLSDVVIQKMNDLKNTSSLIVTFSPEEADLIGAFKEDALSIEAAQASSIDKEGV